MVLATNTSALSVTEIAAATRRPARVLGMHFFNPVPKMKLVEIVRALETGDAAVARHHGGGAPHGQGDRRWSRSPPASSPRASTP